MLLDKIFSVGSICLIINMIQYFFYYLENRIKSLLKNVSTKYL